MQNYAKFALPLAAVCGILTIGVHALLALVIMIHMFEPQARMPMLYFEFLNLPFFSLFLPLVAALALAPLALRCVFSETVTWPKFHLVEHDAHLNPPVEISVAVEQQVAEQTFLKAA